MSFCMQSTYIMELNWPSPYESLVLGKVISCVKDQKDRMFALKLDLELNLSNENKFFIKIRIQSHFHTKDFGPVLISKQSAKSPLRKA